MSENDVQTNDTAGDDNAPEQETVDDILADIYAPDGAFSKSFSEMFSRYLVGESADAVTENIDLSNRIDENIPHVRIEYEDPESPEEDSSDSSIDGKLPESVRGAYQDFAYEAQMPGFTPEGDVKYPTMGVGAAEERVVFDADWEEHAKQEAARLERVRKERMLRGDSLYARSFVTGGRNSAKPAINPAYIDPLSDDDDVPLNTTVKNRKKNFTAVGESEDMTDIRPDWLIVEAQKKGKKSRKVTSVINDDYTAPPDEFSEMYNVAANASSKQKKKNSAENAVYENEELKNTVAQIVDKYNKREKDEEEKKARLEEERLRQKKEQEEREKLLEEEKKRICAGVSRPVRKALESDGDKEDYEDFSEQDNVLPEDLKDGFSENGKTKEEENSVENGFKFSFIEKIETPVKQTKKEEIVTPQKNGRKKKKNKKS